ncbi:hypothetical protein NDN01_25165 [Sphingomonas sp. QA11]|nr:hypothetical protein [Sphingomonas sp. QA11]WCM27235.1 hypothetical protein NDN01_25165 [Sphingomonas sp. QA11]
MCGRAGGDISIAWFAASQPNIGRGDRLVISRTGVAPVSTAARAMAKSV